MKTRLISIALAGAIFCSLSSCSNVDAEAANETAKTEVKATENLDNNSNIEETAVVESTSTANSSGEIDNNGKVKKINTQTFINEVFDYKANPQKWVYKGTKPAIIDFYADWCGPCKKVAPIMDELAIKYKGQVNFYKINTDDEKELSGGVFGIRSIPSILFIPVEGQPAMQPGLLAKDQYIQIIEENLLKK